jgi:DNA-binding CsgD family transcriptional regulator
MGMPASSALTGEEVSIGDALRPRLRALLRCLGDCQGDEASEQMLMDVDLDGRRYLLIRMPSAMPRGISLSPREVEIVRLVAEGHPNKVIASVLEISSWTVCTHMRRVFAKFGVTSRAAMVARVATLGGIADAVLQASPRGRLQEEAAASPHPGAAIRGAPDRRRASVTPLALRHRRGELADAKHGVPRTVVAHQSIR